MLSYMTSSSASLTTNSRAMLNNVGNKVSPCLKPVIIKNSTLNFSLYFECYTHAFISLTSFAGIPSLGIAFQSLYRFIVICLLVTHK